MLKRVARGGVAFVVACLVMAIAPLVAAKQATAADDPSWTSFFDGGDLQGSGWAACPAPISISISDTRLPRKDVDKWVRAGIRTLVVWMRQTGLVFEDGGVVPVTYDRTTGLLSPADGVERRRHIYLSIVPKVATDALTDQVVGLGAPTRVDVANNEIIQAQVTFEREYVQRASVGQLTALLIHEFGHALGLGHSTSRADVMYPIVRTARALGPGDIAGIRALTRPCLSGAPTPPEPQAP